MNILNTALCGRLSRNSDRKPGRNGRRTRVFLLPRGENGYFLAVLFMDLDGFKLLNDSLGPAAGEELLNDVAGHSRTPRMRRSVQRDADQQSIAARVGGDSSSGTVAQFSPFWTYRKSPDHILALHVSRVILRGYMRDTSLGRPRCPLGPAQVERRKSYLSLIAYPQAPEESHSTTRHLQVYPSY